MLSLQKHLFSLPEEVTYLNCAYMSPLLKSVEAAGIAGLRRKAQPFDIVPSEFFAGVEELKKLFAQLIGATEPQRTVIVPSVSYGLANAARNAPVRRGQNIVVTAEQFPSNVYTWQRIADERGAEIRTVSPPAASAQRGKIWNERLAAAIDDTTAVVAVPQVHWADGTLFDLEKLSEKVHAVGGLLITDGTQSVGALPFDTTKIKPDALVCGGYKWLLGGYSFGLAYYGAAFDNGTPIEENWMNRLHSENFSALVNYQPAYKPFAQRYAVGEQSQFVNTPMAVTALRQITEWTTEGIQEYCAALTAEPIAQLRAAGCTIEDAAYRGSHLFGVRLPEHTDTEMLKARFAEQKIIVSFRGNALRISPHLYNDEQDFARLTDCISEAAYAHN